MCSVSLGGRSLETETQSWKPRAFSDHPRDRSIAPGDVPYKVNQVRLHDLTVVLAVPAVERAVERGIRVLDSIVPFILASICKQDVCKRLRCFGFVESSLAVDRHCAKSLG